VPFAPNAFHRLMEPLDGRVLKKIVDTHEGNHGVGEGPKAWTCQRHLKAMLFGQIAGLNSLREIEQGLAAAPKALYHLNLRMAPRSTLSDAQNHRPAEVFRDICHWLMAQANRTLRREGEAFIQLIDATPIPLKDERFDWAEASARTRGLKLHVGYDPRGDTTSWIDVTSAKVNDISAASAMPLVAGAVYVFDKGYLDYSWWNAIHQQGALFVSRLKSNTHRREVQPRRPEGEGILADNDIKIGHAKPRGGAVNPLYDVSLREIIVEREGKEPLRLITNDLTRPAAEVAALYKERWQVELLFKWIKQNLRIRRFLGRSENAVKSQIYIALIAFLLLRLFRQTHASSYAESSKALLARLKVGLFGTFNLMNRAAGPPQRPDHRPPTPQLALNLAI
jgi:putative transposase